MAGGGVGQFPCCSALVERTQSNTTVGSKILLTMSPPVGKANFSSFYSGYCGLARHSVSVSARVLLSESSARPVLRARKVPDLLRGRVWFFGMTLPLEDELQAELQDAGEVGVRDLAKSCASRPQATPARGIAGS